MIRYNRISFCGSSGTGKTTLIETMKVDPQFEGWTFYQNVVRDLHKEGYEINEKSKSSTQRLIFDKYSEILNQMFKQPSVCDRSVVDVAAFTSMLFDSLSIGDPDFMNMSQEEFYERKEVTRRRNDLSLLVYTPIEFPIEDDGERMVDEVKRAEFDRKIVQILKNARIPYLTVTGTVEERLFQIKEVVFLSKLI